METLRAGLDLADLLDHVHAFDDLAEHRVAPALRRRRRVVQEVVVVHVDEELRGRRMRVVGARHRDRAVLVLQTVVRFVGDRLGRRLLLHAGFEAAALDHEAVDHAVKHRVVVVAGLHVVQEVLDRLRCLFGVQFEFDDAVVRMQFNHDGIL
jgi:hypothetical protein